MSLFMDISSEMIYPLVPLFLATVLGTTKATIGLIEGIAESTASILKVFSGWLSDRLGKRRFLMGLGYGVSVLSRPIMATSNLWGQVLAARFIDRVGKGVRTAPRDAIIADSTEFNNLGRAFGFHRAMDTVGAIIGPGVAFFLLALWGNFRLIFWLSAIPGIIAVLLILLIKEKGSGVMGLPLQRVSKSEAKRLIILRGQGLGVKDPTPNPLILNRGLRYYILVISIFSLGNTSDAFIILRAGDVGIPREVIPLTYLLYNVVYSLSSMPMGALADRVGMERMIELGFLLYAGIYLGLAFAPSPHYVWLLFAIYGLFKGMSEGVQRAYLATLAPEDRKATAFGIYHASVGLALLPASIIGGILWDRIGPSATFIYGAVAALSAMVLFTIRSPLRLA